MWAAGATATDTSWQDALFIGVVSSLCASVLFLLLLFLVRPRIHISPVLARTADGEFRVKLVNRSRRAAADVRVQMFVSKHTYSVDGRPVYKLSPVDLKITDGLIVVLPGFRRRDEDCRYARRIVVIDDLDSIWPDDGRSVVLVRVYARDSFSNFGKQRSAQYTREMIEEGDFKTGKDMQVLSRKVVPPRQQQQAPASNGDVDPA